MEYFLPCLGIIAFASVISTTSDVHKLVAVSGYSVAKELYYKLRQSNPKAGASSNIDPDTKKRICHYITGSTFFSEMLEEKRVYMHQIYHELREQNPSLFASLHGPSESSSVADEMVYTNPTRLVKVTITRPDRGTVEENVFTCLTVDSDDNVRRKTFFAYFVSEEYNLGDNASSPAAGRFVFAYSDLDRTSTFYAVAEVPAKSVSSPGAPVERLYLEKRGSHESAKRHFDDPICRLNPRQRLRACTLVLTSSYFEGELKFVPENDYIDYTMCKKNEIAFQDEQVRLETGENEYEEWMISCRPKQYYASFQAEYFLSRVYDSDDKVFVYRYRKEDSKIIIENLFKDVRFGN